MWSDRTFCQFFFRSETRKLTANIILAFNSSVSMETLPTATDKHNTFFIWNLMVRFTVSTFSSMDSWWERAVGNLPALLRRGPEGGNVVKYQFHNSRDETSHAEIINSQLAWLSRLHYSVVKARAKQSLKITLRRRQFCGGILAREGRCRIWLHHRIHSCRIGVSMALELKLSCQNNQFVTRGDGVTVQYETSKAQLVILLYKKSSICGRF
jgi:hypothetical protein